MGMSYRTHRMSRIVPWGAALVGTLLAALILRTTGVQDALQAMTGFASRPLLGFSQSVGKQGEVFFSSRASLIRQLQVREDQLAQLSVQTARWASADAELQQALALLEYQQGAQLTSVTARVLLRDRIGQDHLLIIDRGYTDGIHVYDPVIAEHGVLIGTVQDVGATSSRVALITNADTRIGARTVGASKTSGIIEGGHGPVLALRFVPKNTPLSQSDLIVTSGIDPSMPSGLVIGLINALDEETDGSFSTVFIEPMADLDHVSILSILTRPAL